MCDATNVLTFGADDVRHVRCMRDGEPYCYYHAKMLVGDIQPMPSETRFEKPTILKVTGKKGRVLWEK